MRRLLTGLALAAMMVGPLAAEDMAPEPGIIGTIASQLDAFLADDIDRAFSFASPTIQGLFGSPDNFERMVRDGYPMVWRPGEVTYLDQKEVGPETWQRVMIRDRQGGTHMLLYQMIEVEDGWLINGVRLLREPDVGA